MSFATWSSVRPTASFAAILAMGKPVALEARAEERLTRGFISMIITSPSTGFTAICTLDPPHSTPISRMMATAASLRRWYSLSVSVWAGATVTESPVCTPMGSMFSMEHTMTTLSARSRITSSSYSFQPSRLFSTSTWLVVLAVSPFSMMALYSSMLYAMPPPVPPSVNAGRMMSGKSILSATASASSMVSHVSLDGVLRPIFCIASLNSWRSSALLMGPSLAPMSSMPRRSSVPSSARALARFSAVWPPMVGRTASGASFSSIFATSSGVMGVTYVRSAVPGSVMMVAGLELTRMTS
mmetsp:Transcript_23837/g.81264  ORF Transcript_23837/g.81264 Transcript_23837/m.81264 type:complete len:298 (-) Transcript_23837:292-1185(-)